MKYDPSHQFVTSDHHFGSWKLAPSPWRGPVFTQAEEEELIAKWNSVVRPTDQVFYVGDFCDSGEADLREYRKRLKQVYQGEIFSSADMAKEVKEWIRKNTCGTRAFPTT